jgi:hypothetical protein
MPAALGNLQAFIAAAACVGYLAVYNAAHHGLLASRPEREICYKTSGWRVMCGAGPSALRLVKPGLDVNGVAGMRVVSSEARPWNAVSGGVGHPRP